MKGSIKNKKKIHKKIHSTKLNAKAFSTFELIIVIALVIVVGLSSIPFLSRFFTQSATSDTYNRLLAEFRTAQTNAMLGKQNGPWGVYYGTVNGSKEVILYQGTSYATHTNTAFDQVYAVNPNVTVTGFSDINFSQVSGIPSAATTITITGTSNTTKTIQIDAHGIVNYALAGPTNTPVPVSSPTPPLNWYNSSWLYRQAITINSTKVSGTQTNFPVLINLPSNANLASFAQTTGNDILFTDSSGVTLIPYEIESYNSLTGALVAWVKVPSVSSTANTTIYMYYNNPSAPGNTTANAQQTWPSNYMAVYHLGPTVKSCTSSCTLSVNDSTSNSENGTNTSVSYASNGKIDGAGSFNGTSSWINLPTTGSLTNVTSKVTVSAWVYITTNTQWNEIVLNQWDLTGKSGWNLFVDQFGYAYFGVSVGHSNAFLSDNSTLSTGTWYYLVGTYDGSTVKLYINGVLQPTSTVSGVTFTTNPPNTAISLYSGTGDSFNGLIDDVRIANNALSQSWITTEYNNQSSPSTFYSLAPQEMY